MGAQLEVRQEQRPPNYHGSRKTNSRETPSQKITTTRTSETFALQQLARPTLAVAHQLNRILGQGKIKALQNVTRVDGNKDALEGTVPARVLN